MIEIFFFLHDHAFSINCSFMIGRAVLIQTKSKGSSFTPSLASNMHCKDLGDIQPLFFASLQASRICTV